VLHEYDYDLCRDLHQQIQASIWLALFTVSIFGFGWVTAIAPTLEKWQSLITVIVIAFLIFISTQCDALGCVSKPQMALVITATGILATTVTLLVLGVLEASYDARLDQVKRELAKSQKDAA